jgi:hypothetical protein
MEAEEFVALQPQDRASQVVPLTYKPDSTSALSSAQAFKSDEAVQIALRSLSNLACVYTDRESSMIAKMIEEGDQSILHWFKDQYLPSKILNRHVLEIKDEEDADKVEDIQVWYELCPSSDLELIDKSVCLFLNEVTGFGHLYSDDAKK